MTEEEKEAAFRETVAKEDQEGKAQTYVAIQSIPSQEQVDEAVSQSTSSMSREDMEQTMLESLTSQAGLDQSEVEGLCGFHERPGAFRPVHPDGGGAV